MRRLLLIAISLAGLGAGLAWAAPQVLADARRSGFDFMSRQTQAMQTDDFANPGMLWVQDGADLFKAKAGTANKACADCHAEAKMRGVAARYPALDARSHKPIDLQGRIAQCRAERQGASPLPPESHDLLALAAYVGKQSRGLPISPAADPRLEPFRRQGEALYKKRMGQLNFSCADCHDANAGKHLAGAPIPQAPPTGYPHYRLEWQSLGSLQRRMRGCMTGVRAEPYPYGAAEYVAIELYLMSRAAGMPMETPAVRP
jgi:sulfur-oxidizing protein SoxA